jgi:hypothetical protein
MDLMRQPGAVADLEVLIQSGPQEKTAPWPVIFNCLLHLRKLKVDWNKATISGLEVGWLPKSITWLDFRAISRGQLNVQFANKKVFKVREVLPNLLHLQWFANFASHTVDWVSTLPDTLTSLSVSEILTWSPLPTSLTSLEAEIPATTQIKGELPPQLRSFKTSRVVIAEIVPLLKKLPSTMETLIVGTATNNCLTEVSLLPRNLTFLDLRGPDLPSNLSELPLGLTVLRTRELTSKMQISSLPSTLTHLYIERVNRNVISGSDLLSSLPRRLKILEIFRFRIAGGGKGMRFEKGALDMPPMLETLRVSEMSFAQDSLCSFPPTLSIISMGAIHPATKQVPFWPNLKQLEVTRMPVTPVLLASLAKNAPYLTHLSIAYGDVKILDGEDEEDSDSDSSEEDSSESLLAQRLELRRQYEDQWLVFRRDKSSNSIPKVSQEQIFQFGPKFKRFEIFDCECLGGEVMKIVPPSLTHLEVSCSFLSSEGIQHLSLCNQLIYLHLLYADISGTHFSCLPHSLLRLELPEASHIENHHILDLPRSLTYLNLSSASKLTNECGSLLPPRLTFAELASEAITPQIIDLIPKSIINRPHFFEFPKLRIKNGVVLLPEIMVFNQLH